MDQSYAAIGLRIGLAIDAIHTRKNVKVKAIAREFGVPYNRLRNRLAGTHLDLTYEAFILDCLHLIKLG